jgi:hypothetical protein
MLDSHLLDHVIHVISTVYALPDVLDRYKIQLQVIDRHMLYLRRDILDQFDIRRNILDN